MYDPTPPCEREWTNEEREEYYAQREMKTSYMIPYVTIEQDIERLFWITLANGELNFDAPASGVNKILGLMGVKGAPIVFVRTITAMLERTELVVDDLDIILPPMDIIDISARLAAFAIWWKENI